MRPDNEATFPILKNVIIVESRNEVRIDTEASWLGWVAIKGQKYFILMKTQMN